MRCSGRSCTTRNEKWSHPSQTSCSDCHHLLMPICAGSHCCHEGFRGCTRCACQCRCGSQPLALDPNRAISEGRKGFPACKTEMKRKIFAERLQKVVRHPAGSSSWANGTNRMSYWTDAERKAIRGSSNRAATGNNPAALGAVRVPLDFLAGNVPATVEWRTKAMEAPAKAQGQCGSRWEFASTANDESPLAVTLRAVAQLSARTGDATLSGLWRLQRLWRLFRVHCRSGARFYRGRRPLEPCAGLLGR